MTSVLLVLVRATEYFQTLGEPCICETALDRAASRTAGAECVRLALSHHYIYDVRCMYIKKINPTR